jgi:hypothetical protein
MAEQGGDDSSAFTIVGSSGWLRNNYFENLVWGLSLRIFVLAGKHLNECEKCM